MTAVLASMGGRDAGLTPAAAHAAAAALEVDGVWAGMGSGAHGAALAWGREQTSVALAEAQFTLGQGPGREAAESGAPVLVPVLADAASRWPGFVPAAAELAVRAVFAFPLRLGAISVGVLTAHRTAPGPLTAEHMADALALADAVTLLLLHHTLSGPGSAEGECSAPPAAYRAEVHQATGMISAQLGVSLADALLRLRAHAFGDGRPIVEVAADVVARRLRFEDPT